MYYIYLKHFFNETKANYTLKRVKSVLDVVEVLDKDTSFARIETKTANTFTLYVQVEKPTEENDKNYTNLIDFLSKDYFTRITCNYTNDLKLELSVTKKIENSEYDLTNEITINYPEEKEEEYMALLKRLILLSNFFYIIKTFHNRGIKSFLKIVQLDEEIQKNNKWKLPETVDDSVLKQVETWLETASREYYQIASNNNLIHTHTKNVEKIISWIKNHYNIHLDIEDYITIKEELELKHLNSEAVYKRMKDMKEISLGKIEVGIQKYSNRIQQTAVIIEAFIVYAYTYYIWVHVNEEGLKNSPLYLKFLVPLMVAIGAVLFVEFARELDYGWMEKLNNHPWIKKSVFPITSIIIIALGIYLIATT